MRRFVLILPLILILALAGCATGTQAQPGVVPSGQAAVTVTFDFQKQSGNVSNQFAVWIEDADGNYIKTLYATRFTAIGGYKNRPDAIPVWMEKSGLTDMSGVDAITGATPPSGALKYFWPGIYADPHAETMAMLEQADSVAYILKNIPDEITRPPDIKD